MSPGSYELLQQVALFQRVGRATLEAIQAMGTPRAVEEDGFFFHEDDPATHLYVLTHGRVKMSQVTVDGQQVAMRMIVPGMMFGGVAILSPEGLYPASAQALEDATALAWEGEAFRKLAATDPALSLNMMDLMHTYVEEMQSRFRELATERVEQRVARAVLRLTAQGGKKTSAGEIEISLSRQDLAEMTGTTLYTVSRILSEWERQGMIHSRRESVTIRQPHGLVRIAEDLER